MALKVTLNTVVASQAAGVINNSAAASFYDPLTGTNLNNGHLVSADISGYTSAQLVNIAIGVKYGILTVTTGSSASLPMASAGTYTKYALFSKPGANTPGPGTGITGVAAGEF